jgi:hypothetical protein
MSSITGLGECRRRAGWWQLGQAAAFNQSERKVVGVAPLALIAGALCRRLRGGLGGLRRSATPPSSRGLSERGSGSNPCRQACTIYMLRAVMSPMCLARNCSPIPCACGTRPLSRRRRWRSLQSPGERTRAWIGRTLNVEYSGNHRKLIMSPSKKIDAHKIWT